jgi:diaminopropionate ammonia-lyase
MATRLFYNPHVAPALGEPVADREPLAFHRRLPGYAPTPLVEAPALAARLGVGRVWIKDESHRLGLPSFKILGASWAIYRALAERMGGEPAPWTDMNELVAQVAPLRPLALAAATDGNHGRAVARMAALFGFESRIFVPAGMAAARVRAIESEGAAVTAVDGSYDDAVARAAQEAGERCIVISDTSWPGYEVIARHVIDGYSTIFWEIDDELARRGESGPDLVAVQIGVGALAAALARHYRHSAAHPRIVGVEPWRAACALASISAGAIVAVPGPHDSIMAGLNCGVVSLLAWPLLSAAIDLFVAIEDDWARRAMRELAVAGITAGEAGAAGVAGLLALLSGEAAAPARAALGIDGATRVLALCTEGVTDPAAYTEAVGRAAG